MSNLIINRGILLIISSIPFYYTLRLFSSGFLSNDDANIAVSRFEHNNSIFGSSYDIAQTTGRFYQTIFYALSQIPYLTPQPLLQFSIGLWRSFFILLFFVAVYLFSKYFFGQVKAFLTIFLTAVTIDLSGWYNSLVSYPFWISFGISLTLLSGIFLDRYLLTHKKKEILLFLIFSWIGILSYEAMLGSCLLYIFIFYRYLQLSESKFIPALNQNKKLFALYGCTLTFYFLVYFLFQRLVDGKYAGTELGALNPGVLFSTLIQESFLHSSLKDLFIDESGLFKLKINTFQLERTLLNPLGGAITLAILLMIFSIIAFTRSRGNQLVVQNGAVNLERLWLTFLFFMPNLLLSFSKLRQSSLDNSPYTMSLFSFIFLNLFFASTIVKLLLPSNNPLLKAGCYIVVSVLVLVLSTSATAQIRENISYVNNRAEVSQVWELLDRDDLRGVVENEGETIYSGSIPKVTRTEGTPFWQLNFEKQDPNFLTAGKSSPGYNHLEAVKTNCGYLLVFIQKGNLVKTFKPSGCDLIKITLTTSDYQFPSELGQIFRRGWSNIEVID